MTEPKPKTGTSRIVWGAILMAASVLNFVQLPETLQGDPVLGSSVATWTGAMIGSFGFLALGVWLLVVGLNQRRATRPDS